MKHILIVLFALWVGSVNGQDSIATTRGKKMLLVNGSFNGLINDSTGLGWRYIRPNTTNWTDSTLTSRGYNDGRYQRSLISGTTIKTINGNSLLGSGDIAISGGGGGSTDTSSLSNRINSKLNTASPSYTGTMTTPLSASRLAIIGGSNELTTSAVTSTEAGFLSGVTSSIQSQINTKATGTIGSGVANQLASYAGTSSLVPTGAGLLWNGQLGVGGYNGAAATRALLQVNGVGNYGESIFASGVIRTDVAFVSSNYAAIQGNLSVGKGYGGASPNEASAILDVASTTKGFLPPRMTTTQRNAIESPATGLTIYNLSDNIINTYNGTTWSGGGATAWGGIAGTLSNQTDLQTALNAKENTIAAGTTAQYWRGDKTWQTLPSGGGGSVTDVSVVTANGVSGTVSNSTTTPAITLALGAITPTSVSASGSVTGSNLSGTNTGDNAANSLYSGLISNATHTGDATGATALTLATVNSNVGSFGSTDNVGTFTVNGKGLITAAGSTAIAITQGQVSNLTTDLSNKQATLVSGTNIKTINGNNILGSGDITISGGSATDTSSLSNRINAKQNTLISSTNIKTVNGNSLLGSGDLIITADIESGVYVPTLTNVSNISSVTPYQCQYMRVGNTVTVSGKIEIGATAISTNTKVRLSLPFSSAFTDEENCGGTGASTSLSAPFAIRANPFSNDAMVEFVSSNTTNNKYFFSYTYYIYLP